MVRLTNKLERCNFDEIPEKNDDKDGDQIPEQDSGNRFMHPYPFCPLCLGVRDQINNLLEVGSTIKSIEVSK